jgi:phosphate transport system protein
MIEGHIARAFDGALLALHLKIVEMGGLALDQAGEAMRAYEDWNLPAANRVMERERAVNAYDREIDRAQLTLIARRHPVGSDLRIIIAMSKMVGELERVGDEAKKIARVVIDDTGRPAGATARDAVHLGQLAQDLLRMALDAVDRLDFELAAKVIPGDRELDVEYAAGLRRLLTRAMENPRGFEVTVKAAFVLKSLERIGDHARNLARHVLSMQAMDTEAQTPEPVPAQTQTPPEPSA